MTQMWSCRSTATPAAWPMSHRFGRGLGHPGSTWNRGARASAVRCARAAAMGRIDAPTPRTTATTERIGHTRASALMLLVDPLLLAPPLLLAQHELLDLPGGGLRQVAELDGGRTLEVSDVPAAELDDLLLGRRHPRLQRDERFGPLAPPLVGDRDHRALEHGGVLGDGLLDLDRRDILTARDDDVLIPVALLEVARHDVVAAHDDLTERLAVLRHVVHVGAHDAYEVEERVALPLAGGEARLLLERLRVPLFVPCAHGVRAVGLCEAVDMDGPEAELPELAEERRRGRGARDAHRDRVPEPVGLRVVDDADVDGRRAVVVGDSLLVDQLPDPGGLHLAQADMGAGDGGDAPGETPAVAVEHRERPEVLRVEAHVRLDH